MWILRMLARLILPMIFQKVVKKAQQNSSSRQQGSYRKADEKIHVDFIPPKDKEAKAADKAGEFIEYEEIK